MQENVMREKFLNWVSIYYYFFKIGNLEQNDYIYYNLYHFYKHWYGIENQAHAEALHSSFLKLPILWVKQISYC